MKESSKLYRSHKEREMKKLAKRLEGPTASSVDNRGNQGQQNIRQNLESGQFAEVIAPKEGYTEMKPQRK